VVSWVTDRLHDQGYPLPACKRIALLVTGFIGSETGTVGELTGTLHGLAVSSATEESIARRMLRILEDERLDPERLLPALFRDVLPELLAEVLAAHEADEGTRPGHHARVPRVRVVADESSTEDEVHLLVAGLAYQGLVLPLAVRVWRQNEPMAEGDYRITLQGLLLEVQELLPARLRDHVLLLADRAYGIPMMLDLAVLLGWDWVLRVQHQTHVLRRDGSVCAIRALAPRPGTAWVGSFGEEEPATDLPEGPGDEPVAVFKTAGWRTSRVVALWAEEEQEPWLLITSLRGTKKRFLEYAERWALERLFLSWKSHGWDIESCGVRESKRFGRLVSGLVVATLWRLAMGVVSAGEQLEDLAARAARRVPRPRQLRLPLGRASGCLASEAEPATLGVARPYAAKFSLLTLGRKVAHATALGSRTPLLSWRWPAWDAPRWSVHCHQIYAGLS
jgi:hypothetical protein